jgi:hypothetical protein
MAASCGSTSTGWCALLLMAFIWDSFLGCGGGSASRWDGVVGADQVVRVDRGLDRCNLGAHDFAVAASWAASVMSGVTGRMRECAGASEARRTPAARGQS